MFVGKRTDTEIRKKYETRSKKAIEYALALIKESELAPYIKHIYLYGSCARNEQTFESDVDILMEMAPEFGEYENKTSSIIGLKRGMCQIPDNLPRVELKFVIGDDWENSNQLFFANIKKDGVELW